ncbi:MAG: phosphatidate cytidylyltransferase [Phycisphaerales bacterium]|nr:phosphatidate cytidylyltransferase [Phycisphaerales bacterium]
MNARWWDIEHAVDHPAVRVMLLMVAGLLVGAGVIIGVLSVLGKLKSEMRTELIRRTVAWGVMVPVVVGPILIAPAWGGLMMGVVSLLCYREFARATGLFREKALSALVAVSIGVITFSVVDHWYGFFMALGPLSIVVILAAATLRDEPKGYIQRIGLASLAVLLFGVCLGHAGYLCNDGTYRPMVLLLLACVGLNDIFAFCCGKLIGGAKLAPTTSPGKTISGAVGAITLTTVTFVVLGSMVFTAGPLSQMHHLIVMGIMVSTAGILGDLTISSVKRDIGIKDMGVVIPGHGGVLDRCNSLLLTAPAFFHYVGYFQGVGLDTPTRVISGGLGP